MYIRLIRNQSQGAAITGRLVIDGRWFCNTLERKGYEIPALCYHLAVTQSPRFKRLLPIVQNVPQRSGIRFHRGTKPEHSTGCILVLADNELKTTQTTISQTNTICDKENDSLARCDVGTAQMLSKLSSKSTKPEHSTGCILVVADNMNDNIDNLRGNQLPAALKENIPCRSRDIDSSGNNRSNECEIRTLSKLSSNNNSSLSSNKKNIGCRTAADVENKLTQLLLEAQNNHEEIILEVIDYRPGTDLGYDTPCHPELQKR